MPSPKKPKLSIVLEKPSNRRQDEFLRAVRRSRKFHGRWADPPNTSGEFRAFLRQLATGKHLGHFVCQREEEKALVGVININEITRGRLQSGSLGYYAFAPYAGRGYMREGLQAVLRRAFGKYGLHRVEANIQPENVRSIALVEGMGFEREGYSRRYLMIGGRWRDHERWALTLEGWRKHRRK